MQEQRPLLPAHASAQRPPQIPFSLLSLRFPQASAADLAQKLYSAPVCKGSGRFRQPKLSQSAFAIQHYAGEVTYECANFLDKNKDFVVAEHQALLQVR